MNYPIVGARYRHKYHGKEYSVTGLRYIKIKEDWIENGLVLYSTLDTHNEFARLTPDFMEYFERVSEQGELPL
jgi:hypothetical protein